MSALSDRIATVYREESGRVLARLIRVLEQATLADFVARAEATGIRRAVLPATMYSI